ncbi:hypothetical protein GCM10011344_38980 [Dokdonia pacifica]|uniref:Uncharacterized protein n=1 Tax=Dokdonia pacifica TaxID=1627892 RepID=A0A239A2R1_9FLAO|nr:hypothetical protein [Dokdonia pacifica]GGG34397.1 hypothetical protein GCM10011344_38980 [Dokdonia pacifica]SNR89304.1 hypothetical protein SAMN06265376_10477 [Dokdonia pacifica]
MKKKKKIDLRKFKIASLTTMKTLTGGTGDETGSFETGGTAPNTLEPECDANTDPIPTSNNPLNPPGCLQTSAIHVSNGCNMG